MYIYLISLKLRCSAGSSSHCHCRRDRRARLLWGWKPVKAKQAEERAGENQSGATWAVQERKWKQSMKTWKEFRCLGKKSKAVLKKKSKC